jgi:hypothetical protein
MWGIRGTWSGWPGLFALACGLGLTSAAAVSQQTPPAGDQCAVNHHQITLCRQAIEQCAVDVRKLIEQRNQARAEASGLRTRACGPDTEPRWRDIVKHLIAARLDPLKREPQPGTGNCERFAYEVAGNARVVLDGRTSNVAGTSQRVKDELRQALPGIQIEIDESRLTAIDECLRPIDASGGWSRDGDTPQVRDALPETKRARMPPDTECTSIGDRIDAHAALDPTLRKKHEDGFWVLDGGFLALCRKEGVWVTKKTNIHPGTPGIVILREQPR